MATTTTAALPLRAAAAQMGLSVDTLRKRLQRGLTPGRKVDGQWFVEPLGPPDPSGPVQDGAGGVQDRSGHVRPPPGDGLLTPAGRAEELAVYTERLLGPWRAIVQAQAEEIGALKAQLAAATADDQAEDAGAAPRSGGRRPWWRRLGDWLR
jgi:hypothetical protein